MSQTVSKIVFHLCDVEIFFTCGAQICTAHFINIECMMHHKTKHYTTKSVYHRQWSLTGTRQKGLVLWINDCSWWAQMKTFHAQTHTHPQVIIFVATLHAEQENAEKVLVLQRVVEVANNESLAAGLGTEILLQEVKRREITQLTSPDNIKPCITSTHLL